MTARHRVIGKSAPLIDGPEKVVGRGRYVPDLKLPGMLHGKILRSPVAHARIRSVNVDRATHLQGVKAVLTGQDIPQVQWGFEVLDQTALAIEKVRFIGEEIVAVAAVDEATAQDAIELIRVDYEPLPEVFSPSEALAKDAPALHEKQPGNCAHRLNIVHGNTKENFEKASAIHEGIYHTPLQYQAYTEPIGSLAEVDPRGKITVWSSTQSVFFTRARVAQALGIAESRVRVIQPHVGGAFGGKWCDEPNAMLSALLATKTGRPVRLINTRLEEFQGGGHPRVPMRIDLKIAADKEGRILAKTTDILADAGAYTGWSARIMEAAAIRADSCYKIKNIQTRACLAYTNNPPTGPFRGFGVPQMVFALESCIDDLGVKLKLDPIAIREVNAVSPGDVSVHGWKIQSCALKECIERAAAAAGWKEHKTHRKDKGKKRRGIGIACAIHVSGSRRGDWDGATALVHLNPDGRAAILTGEGDIGQGTKTMLAQVCAETIGLDISDVEVSAADTDLTPPAGGASASRLTMISGNAVEKAARVLRERLQQAAASLLKTDISEIEANGSYFYVKGFPERQVSIADATAAAISSGKGEPLVAYASYDAPTESPDPKTLYGNIAMGYTFSVVVADIEIDLETGTVAVQRITAADDIGVNVNPLLSEGQAQGGIIQALGLSLYERLVLDHGQAVTGNFADYTLPRAEGMPGMDTIAVESKEALGPFGAKSAAETAIDSTAAAVSNAVYDAVGIRMTSLPITPQILLAEIRQRMKGL